MIAPVDQHIVDQAVAFRIFRREVAAGKLRQRFV